MLQRGLSMHGVSLPHLCGLAGQTGVLEERRRGRAAGVNHADKYHEPGNEIATDVVHRRDRSEIVRCRGRNMSTRVRRSMSAMRRASSATMRARIVTTTAAT